MYELPEEVRRAQARIDLARANREGPEVMHALMIDLASAMEGVETIPGHRYAEKVRQTANTLVPMFGMNDEPLESIPRWRWRKRKAWRPPNHDERLRMYRDRMV